MAKILYIDDDQKTGEYTKNALEEAGHNVDWIHEDSWSTAVKAFEDIPEKAWDLLILDIQYPTNEWGGIWVYNNLIGKGFKPTWKGRALVYSQYFEQGMNWEDPGDMQMLLLRVFLETAGIPFNCAMPNQTFDRASLLEKIQNVLS